MLASWTALLPPGEDPIWLGEPRKESGNLIRSLHKSISAEITSSHTALLEGPIAILQAAKPTGWKPDQQCYWLNISHILWLMNIWFPLPLRRSMWCTGKVLQTWLLIQKDQSLHLPSPGLLIFPTCASRLFFTSMFWKSRQTVKTEYHLDTSDTLGASIGASPPTGTFSSYSFSVINHLQMLPQQHSCGRLSTSVWIPCSNVTRARKIAALKF